MSDPGRTASGGSGEGTATPQHPDGARLMAACGEHIDLVADAWFDALYGKGKGDQFINGSIIVRRANVDVLWSRPFHRAIQSRYVNCQCSPFNSIILKNQVVSGSTAEALDDPARPTTFQCSSDTDVMIELGPVDCAPPDDSKSSSADNTTTGAAPTADLMGLDGDPPPRLVITETENPGFVLLLQERRDDCPHQERLFFKAEDVIELFKDFQKIGLRPDHVAKGVSGPAISFSDDPATPSCSMFEAVDYDLVPCLHVAVWFVPDEFFTRHRQHNWPPEAVRDNIRQFGLHLVPVGAPGSSTERLEFRISFSRAEILLASLLTGRQRHAIIAFKLCRALVPNGKMVKSYYAKTALLWLCERTPKDDWTTVSQSVIKLLDFLEEAVDTGNLPCYFWSQLNLLRFTSQGERKVMKKALQDIRQNLNTLLAAELCVYKPGLQEMLTQTTTQLTERQVRACLARWHIVAGVTEGLCGYLAMTAAPVVENLLSVLINSQQLTFSSVIRLFRPYSHCCIVRTCLYKALTVVPAEVTLKAHPTSMDPGFVWDAAPLLDLLTEDDLRRMLGDPDAVRAWLWRQQQLPKTERPAGLPADLRSPQDLCDLLLNIPLLSRTLRESVPTKWHKWRMLSELVLKSLRVTHVEKGEFRMKRSLATASRWKDLAFVFQTRLGMDRQTALRTACRYGVELRRLCDDPETVREYERRRRRLPDPWGVLSFLLRGPL